MKEHKPSEDAWDGTVRSHPTEAASSAEKLPENAYTPRKDDGGSLLEQLYRTLRGFGGTEEVILLLVLLIVSSDGLCPEALILAILLISGGKT